MKALVVVAERSTRQSLEDFFRSRRLPVVCSFDTEKARRALAEDFYPFVLVDLEVRGDPAELCRDLRQGPRGENVYVVALAPGETLACLRGAFEAGVDDYLIKPLNLDALRLRLAISERRLAIRRQIGLAEERLEHSERRYRTLIETMHEGLFEVGEDGLIEFANSRLSKITGYNTDELMGQRAVELLVDPEVRERLPEGQLLGTGTGSEEYALPFINKDGERIWVNLTGAPVVGLDGRSRSIGVVDDVTVERQAQEALRHREAYFRALSENTSDIISILDLDGVILYQSSSSDRMLGWAPEDLVSQRFLEIVHGEDHEAFWQALQRTIGNPETVELEFRARHRETGEFRNLEVLCDDLTDNPVVGGVLLTARDITERKHATQELERQRAFFQQLFRNSPAGIVILDNQDQVVDANHSFTQLFQFSVDEMASQPLGEFIVPERYREEARELSEAVFNKRIVECETMRQRKDGEEIHVAIVGYPIELEQQRIGAYGIYSDITKRKQAENQLIHDALHDALTDLPNRAKMNERLEEAIQRSQRGDFHFGLMFIDLDRFKVVNDSLGHAAGDELLIETARRLKSCVRPGDMVARLGGDEFTVILEDLHDYSGATRVAERILTTLAQPFHIGGQEIVNSGSIGIALSFTSYTQADDMVRDADIAMYRAKNRGKACYEIFDSQMHESVVEQLRLETSLRRAIEEEQLVVYYQPVVALATGQLVGFEALLRWQHPEHGLLGPEHVIPTAEESHLILHVGQWVFRKVCQQLAHWQKLFPENDGLRISVNVSVKEITHADYLDGIFGSVAQAGIKPASVALELTESLTMEAGEAIREVLWKLKKKGFRLYLDDFGTGYSSLGSLHSLPVDTVKIDRQFIQRLEEGNEGLEVVRAIYGLGENLGMGVIAEGVETEAQRDALRELGMNHAQGYLFARPLPVEEAERLLREGGTLG